MRETIALIAFLVFLGWVVLSYANNEHQNVKWCTDHGGFYARELYNNHCEFPPKQ